MPLLGSGTAPPPVYPPPVEEEYIPPPTEEYVEPAPAPVEQAPPPVAEPAPTITALPEHPTVAGGTAPPSSSGISTLPEHPTIAPVPQSSTPPQEQQSTINPPASQNPPTDEGRLQSAYSAGARIVSEAPGAVGGAVSEFTGIGKEHEIAYQPADPTVAGAGEIESRRQVAEAEEGYQEARRRSAENPLDLRAGIDELGAFKDSALAKLGANKGEISPERANQTRTTTERLANELEHGDPFYGEEPNPIDRAAYENYFGQSDYADWARENPDLFKQALAEGYTTPDGYVWAPGLDAPWEVFQSGRSGVERAVADIGMAPLSAAADVVSSVLTAGGTKLTTEAAEQAARLGVKQTGKQAVGQTLQGAGRVVDAAASMGLSEVVPASFNALGKAYKVVPWAGKQTADAANLEQAEGVAEAGQAVLSQVRSATDIPGAQAPEPTFIQNPTSDPTIYRVAMPDDGSGAGPIDLTYKTKYVTDPDGTKREQLVGVYDTALPAPTDRYRRLTEADAQTIYDAWGRLPNADRQRLRQVAFPQLTKIETTPGEPFIEQAAERVYDNAGNVIADTGRVGAGYDREVEDLRRTIMRDGRPDQIITDFTSNWQKTLYDNKLHPLTRHPLAAHRLQTLKDVVQRLPAHMRTAEIDTHIREMENLLPRNPRAQPYGSGAKWRGPLTGTSGGLVPLSAREERWLTEVAAMPVDQFKGALDPGRVGGSKGLNIIFDRKPPTNAGQAFENGYAAYQDVMRFRLTNPPTARREIGDLKDEINGLRAQPGPAAQSRQDAIQEALEINGIIPPGLPPDPDSLVIAIDNYMRTTRPTFPRLPGASPGPPAGVFRPGSQQELWGIDLDQRVVDELDTQVEIGGINKTAGQRLREHWIETRTAYDIAQYQKRGIALTPADAKTLDTQVNKIASRFPGEYRGLTGTQLGEMSVEEIDRLAASLLKADMQIAQGVRSSTGKMLTPAEKRGLIGAALGKYDQFIGMWRSAVLYNVGRGAQYIGLQAAGNAVTGLIATKGNVLPYYANLLQWKRGYNYLRNPEVASAPRAIEIRDKLGLGRSANLGRTSRDQMGARTGFNQEDSHAVTKAIGSVVGNQKIKDLADSWDLRLRHGLYEMVMGPAYSRLKRDLVPMVEKEFDAIARARGVPLSISRDQISAALRNLEATNGGYFNAQDLRKAIYEAAGGNAAPHRNELMGAARNVASSYDKEVRKLDDLAQAEVDRVAFSGGDTNLEAVIQRLGAFTWWVMRASRLFAVEASKSPVQMALWARALEASHQNEREGASPRYRQMIDFLQTPAGYTASLNPFSLLGTYLLGTTADPADPRNVLTRLGEITEGGFVGDNLVLSPLIKGALYTIGALGQDARAPDVLGIGRLEREIIDALNYVNQHWVTFHQTEAGNPDRIPAPGMAASAINMLATRLSGHIPGTQEVAGYDPNAPAESQIAALIGEQMMRDNPDLDPADEMDAEILRRGVDLAMADHDSPLYQEAQERWVDSLYLGPGSGSGGVGDVVGAITSHWVLPTNIMRQPTILAETREQKNRDQMRKDGSTTLTSQGEVNEFERLLSIPGSRSEAGRDLALIEDLAAGDPLTIKMRDTYNAVVYKDAGDIKATFEEQGWDTITIDGYEFTADQIAKLSIEDRKALGNAWVDSSGYRPVMDAYWENRELQLRSDRVYADAEGWGDYAKQYPGGIARAVEDTAQVNPNYRKFIEGYVVRDGEKIYLPDLRKSSPADWESIVTTSDEAKTAIAGIQDSKYGLKADPRYAGMVGGLTQPVGTWYVESLDAEKEGGSEFEVGLREDYAQFEKVAPGLDALDAAWGRPIGTTRANMVAGILNGALDSASDKNYALSYEEHKALEAMGISDYLPETTRLKSYLEWELQQPAGADTSLDAYQQAYWSRKNEEAVPDIALRLATGQVAAPLADGETQKRGNLLSDLVMTDAGVAPGVRPGPAVLAMPTILASEPGGTQGIQAPAGTPIQTGQKMQGSDGSVWVEVVAGPGITGWVDIAELAAA